MPGGWPGCLDNSVRGLPANAKRGLAESRIPLSRVTIRSPAMTDDDRRPPSTLLSAAASLRSAWRDLARRAARSATFRIVAFSIAVRVFTAFMAFIVNVVFPLAQKQQFTVLDRTHLLWDTFARYDSGWYFGIARHGYDFVEGGRNNLAFFPVYPLLMRYVGLALGGGRQNLYLAGVIISWVAYVLAMVMLYRLGRTYLPRAAAERAVVFASVFPFAFFYGVVYSEALFLLFTVTAFYGFRTKRWWLGAVAGALACATRVNGIMALPALGLLAWQSAGKDAAARKKALAAVALVPVGLVLYSVYVDTLSGSYFEWTYSIQRWNYSIAGSPIRGFVFVISELVARPYRVHHHSPDGPVRHPQRFYGTRVHPLAALRRPPGRRGLRGPHGAQPLAAPVLRRVRGRRALLRGAVPVLLRDGDRQAVHPAEGPAGGVGRALHALPGALGQSASDLLTASDDSQKSVVSRQSPMQLVCF